MYASVSHTKKLAKKVNLLGNSANPFTLTPLTKVNVFVTDSTA